MLANGLEGAPVGAVAAPAELVPENKEEKVLAGSEVWAILVTCAIEELGGSLCVAVASAFVVLWESSLNALRRLDADAGDSVKIPPWETLPFVWMAGGRISLSSSLTKRASSSVGASGSGAGSASERCGRKELSIIPRVAASFIFKPSMIATMLLPARFDSTYFSENECSDDGWKAMDSMCQSRSDMADIEKTHSIIAVVR